MITYLEYIFFCNASRLLLLLLICICYICPLPFNTTAQIPSVNFRHIKSENGLSNSTIETILQDSRGFMLFGTSDGLNRYDGKQMIVYRNSSTDSTSISDNFITSLYEDQQHNLWVGTRNGLNLFNSRLNSFTRLKTKQTDEIASNHIATIYGDSKGRIWIGTTGGGISLYHAGNNSFKRMVCRITDNTSPVLNINTFLEDSRGNLWAGTESGLFIYENGRD